MILNCHDLLREATGLAIAMVDQVEYVDLLDAELSQQQQEPVREDAEFCRDATAYVRAAKNRDAAKRVIENLARRLRSSPFRMKTLNPHEVDLAAEMVTRAVKSLLVCDGDNGWLRARRLVVKFGSVPRPWIEGAGGYRGQFRGRRMVGTIPDNN